MKHLIIKTSEQNISVYMQVKKAITTYKIRRYIAIIQNDHNAAAF